MSELSLSPPVVGNLGSVDYCAKRQVGPFFGWPDGWYDVGLMSGLAILVLMVVEGLSSHMRDRDSAVPRQPASGDKLPVYVVYGWRTCLTESDIEGQHVVVVGGQYSVVLNVEYGG